MVKRFPTIPSHAEVKCLFYDEHSSRQDSDVVKEVLPLALLSCLRHLR